MCQKLEVGKRSPDISFLRGPAWQLGWEGALLGPEWPPSRVDCPLRVPKKITPSAPWQLHASQSQVGTHSNRLVLGLVNENREMHTCTEGSERKGGEQGRRKGAEGKEGPLRPERM